MSLEKFFKGRSVMVTGAGRGIGRSLCIKLDSLGSTVYAISQNPNNLSTLKSQCPKIQTIVVDLSDWDSTRATLEKLEPVDCLVNNAGLWVKGNFMDVKLQDLGTITSVNLYAVINVSQIVAKKMISAGKLGSIVNVSSVAGLKAMPKSCVYSVSKAALDQLTKIMAIELAPHTIRVNSINPGGVETDMLREARKVMEKTGQWSDYSTKIPLQREIIEMDEILNSILFLLSDLVPYTTGVLLPIDGGFSIN